MKKNLLLIATAALLSLPSIPSALAQHVYIQVGPPHVLVEHPGPRPHPGWYWRAGYYRWDGHATSGSPANGSLRLIPTPSGSTATGVMNAAAGTGSKVTGANLRGPHEHLSLADPGLDPRPGSAFR